MKSNNLPAAINALTENTNNKIILKSKIKLNNKNLIFFYASTVVFAPALALIIFNPGFFAVSGLLGAANILTNSILGTTAMGTGSNRSKNINKLTQTRKVNLELESGEKKVLRASAFTLPTLIDAMKNDNDVYFVLNKKNENKVEDYVVLPEEAESGLDKFITTLANNKRVFFKNDDIWSIRYNKEFTQLKDFKGPNYVHYLLQNPHKECSLWELHTAINKLDYEAIDAVSDPSANLKSEDDEEKDKIQKKSSSYDEVNEAYNRLNLYRKSLERLDDSIEEAEAENDIKKLYKIEKLKHDRKILMKEINRIDNEINHKNFNRNTDNRDEEKIRQAISQAYKQFKRTIKTDKTCNLHKHLTRSIVTGKEYKYDPEGSDIDWVLDL